MRKIRFLSQISERYRAYLSRRPHRSFRLTRRRDLPKRVVLPGYISFTVSTFSTLLMRWRLYGVFLVFYMLLATLLVGIVQQDQYSTLVSSIKEFGPSLVGGEVGNLTQTAALFGAAITGGLGAPIDQTGQISLTLLGIFSWLVIVWLLRQQLAGNAVRFRDGLYNAGAPFISTILIAILIAIQLLPAALGILAYTAANTAGVVSGGVESMAFGIGMVLLVVLSLYWVTSSFLAGVIITLPGTYPMAAIKNGGDLAFGRRTAIVLRLGWLVAMIFVIWAVLLVPVLLLDNAIHISWLPIVPITVQLLGALSVLYSTSYIYLLYRKMIDEPA